MNSTTLTLYAFSLEHEPHMAVNTFVRPAGATRMKLSSSSCTQSAGGIRPRDGRLMIAVVHSRVAAACGHPHNGVVLSQTQENVRHVPGRGTGHWTAFGHTRPKMRAVHKTRPQASFVQTLLQS